MVRILSIYIHSQHTVCLVRQSHGDVVFTDIDVYTVTSLWIIYNIIREVDESITDNLHNRLLWLLSDYSATCVPRAQVTCRTSPCHRNKVSMPW
jgi:hypothetical protein